MSHFLKVKLKKKASQMPAFVRSILKASGIKKIWEIFIGKYADELSFQLSWAKAYNGKNKELVVHLLSIWKEYRCLDDILSICKISDKSKILDVGCGIATVLNIIKGERYGVDPLAEDYKKIYKYPEDINIRKGSAEEIPFYDRTFDDVFCSNALDHTTNPESALSEIKRVLKNNGYFILIVEVFEQEKKRDIKHPHSFTLDSVKPLLSNAELKTIFEKTNPWHGQDSDGKGYVAILAKRTS